MPDLMMHEDANGRVVATSPANPLPVGLDQPITPTSTVVAVGVATAEALAANANRKYVLLVNDSDTTVYLGLGVAAVVGQGIRLSANGGSLELDAGSGWYVGAINAIHGGTGAKNLLITEGV